MNLDDMIAAERSAPPEATKTQAAQMWRSIEHSFVSVVPAAGAPAAAAKASTLGKLGLGKLSGSLSTTVGKVVLATTLVGGGAVGVSRLSESSDTPATEHASLNPLNGRVPAMAPARLPSEAPQKAPVMESPTPALMPQPPQAKEAATRPPPPEPKPARVRPSAKPMASVQEELALIQRMQTALRSGAHERALTLARQHTTTYPEGAFVEDRAALRVLALCESANAEASASASEFHKRWPKSMHRSRIEAACE